MKTEASTELLDNWHRRPEQLRSLHFALHCSRPCSLYSLQDCTHCIRLTVVRNCSSGARICRPHLQSALQCTPLPVPTPHSGPKPRPCVQSIWAWLGHWSTINGCAAAEHGHGGDWDRARLSAL